MLYNDVVQTMLYNTKKGCTFLEIKKISNRKVLKKKLPATSLELESTSSWGVEYTHDASTRLHITIRVEYM